MVAVGQQNGMNQPCPLGLQLDQLLIELEQAFGNQVNLRFAKLSWINQQVTFVQVMISSANAG